MFLSGFFGGWSLFSQSGFDQEKFIVDVVIPRLLPFSMKKSLKFKFQVSIWNLEFIGSQI